MSVYHYIDLYLNKKNEWHHKESQVFLSFIRKPPRNFNSDSVKMTNQSTLLIWCWHKHFHGAIYRRVLIQILYMFQVGKFENVVFDK